MPKDLQLGSQRAESHTHVSLLREFWRVECKEKKGGAWGSALIPGVGSGRDPSKEGLIYLSVSPRLRGLEHWDCVGTSPSAHRRHRSSNWDIQEREEGRAGHLRGKASRSESDNKEEGGRCLRRTSTPGFKVAAEGAPYPAGRVGTAMLTPTPRMPERGAEFRASHSGYHTPTHQPQ